ncbi:MAG: hypothetical protein ACOYPS_10615, partial [Phycisphaerales bacterium]
MPPHVARNRQAGTLAMILASSMVVAQGRVEPPAAEPAALIASLEHPEVDASGRRVAATRLLGMASTNLVALDALERLLSGSMVNGSAASQVVAAIAAADEPAPPLLLTLETRLEST